MNDKVERFAKILREELEKDHWGDIDPGLFGAIANPEPEDEYMEDVVGLKDVLRRTLTRYEKDPD